MLTKTPYATCTLSRHVDDEVVIASWGRQFGFNTYLLNAQDDDWKEKIMACADRIRRIEHQESFA